MVTRADIITRFPELSSCQVGQVTAIIDDVNQELDSGVAYGDSADRAVIYLSAHYLALLKLAKSGAAGAVTSESKSGVAADGKPYSMSVAYATPQQSADKDLLRQTIYGTMFLMLREAAVDVIPILVV